MVRFSDRDEFDGEKGGKDWYGSMSDNLMNFFDGEAIDFSKPDPFIKWETRCPNCRKTIFFVDNSKTPDYWKDMAEERLRLLKKANSFFLKIDEWCMKNIGDTYMAVSLRKIYDEFNKENP